MAREVYRFFKINLNSAYPWRGYPTILLMHLNIMLDTVLMTKNIEHFDRVSKIAYILDQR